MKGLLFRKQPLHTSPTTGAKAVELSPAFLRANVCELSHTFLRAMRASPHLHPKGKDGLFSSLLRISLLFLIVLVSVRSNRLLQAREIRRIGFSLTFSYPLRLSTELKKLRFQLPKARLKEQPCFVKYIRINLCFKNTVNFLC